MNEPHDDRAERTELDFADKAKRLFDESVQGLDARTQSQLNRGRQQALAAAGSGKRFSAIPVWAPAAGVAAAAVFAVLLWTGKPPATQLAPPAAATDFEILIDGDNLEMLEDLEFYSWIDLRAEPGSGANVG